MKSNFYEKIMKYLLDSGYRKAINTQHGFGGAYNLSDEEAIKRIYKGIFGRDLNLENPQTFNEKLQWLKIYDRKPIYTTMVDKCAVKKYVADKIGEEYIILTIGIWERFEDIDFDSLPNQFVLKCTHDSGGLVICKDKSELDIKAVKKKITKCLRRNYYYSGREWPYKDVKPCIIAEEYLENNHEGLHDYKVWCFNGRVEYIQYITGRICDTIYEAFYDREWNKQEFYYHNPIMKETLPKPKCLAELIECAEKLASGTAFLRTDFYILNDRSIKFGECTFYPMAGLDTWNPQEMDLILGKKIDLSKVNRK